MDIESNGTPFADEMSQDECEDELLEFKLTFSYAEWQALLVTQEYKRTEKESQNSRTYYILKQNEWCNVFYKHFFSITKLPCPIAFRRCKIYPCGSKFFEFEGKCPECDSKIEGYTYDEPQPEFSIVVHCIYKGNFANCQHTKQRIIRGKTRELYAQKLL